jgi:hypothetical protein
MVFTKSQAIACLVKAALGGRLRQFSSTHNQNEYHQFEVSQQQQTPCVERVARVWRSLQRRAREIFDCFVRRS